MKSRAAEKDPSAAAPTPILFSGQSISRTLSICLMIRNEGAVKSCRPMHAPSRCLRQCILPLSCNALACHSLSPTRFTPWRLALPPAPPAHVRISMISSPSTIPLRQSPNLHVFHCDPRYCRRRRNRASSGPASRGEHLRCCCLVIPERNPSVTLTFGLVIKRSAQTSASSPFSTDL